MLCFPLILRPMISNCRICLYLRNSLHFKFFAERGPKCAECGNSGRIFHSPINHPPLLQLLTPWMNPSSVLPFMWKLQSSTFLWCCSSTWLGLWFCNMKMRHCLEIWTCDFDALKSNICWPYQVITHQRISVYSSLSEDWLHSTSSFLFPAIPLQYVQNRTRDTDSLTKQACFRSTPTLRH